MVKEEKAIKRVWSGWNLLVCCVRGQKGLQQVPDHSNYAQHNTKPWNHGQKVKIILVLSQLNNFTWSGACEFLQVEPVFPFSDTSNLSCITYIPIYYSNSNILRYLSLAVGMA